MALPCICVHCAIYLSLQCGKDEHCLAVEEAGCPDIECTECRLTCDQFTKMSPFKETFKLADALPS